MAHDEKKHQSINQNYPQNTDYRISNNDAETH